MDSKISSRLHKVQHIILVLSGKGGVGKSTCATQLALSLCLSNPAANVGLLDIDLCGPSVAKMLNMENMKFQQSEDGWIPIQLQLSTGDGNSNSNSTLKVMSIAFLLESRNDAVIWRGPKKTAMIKQFLGEVAWGDLDYLIIDTPPGTSDEHITVVESLLPFRPDGAVIVTTPQAVATVDVRKEVNFCHKVGLNVIGVIENMSGYVCPHCEECTNIFSKGGGEQLAKDMNIPFLGTLPIEPNLGACAANGLLYTSKYPNSQCASMFNKIVHKILSLLPDPPQ